jgi:putative ABC transport system ATP-binding protein
VPEPLLLAEHVSKTWDAAGPSPVHAVRDASLAVCSGETLVITGPSGSGKTTLLTMLGALLHPDAGRIRLDGIDLGASSERARDRLRLGRVGFVFQRGLLLSDLSVLDNVALVHQEAGHSRRDALARARTLLERFDVLRRARARPDDLSAGERQRVAVARALANRPRIVLADEPTAHLDSKSGRAVAAEMERACSADGAALVLVTHDERLASLAERRLRLEDGVLR